MYYFDIPYNLPIYKFLIIIFTCMIICLMSLFPISSMIVSITPKRQDTTCLRVYDQ